MSDLDRLRRTHPGLFTDDIAVCDEVIERDERRSGGDGGGDRVITFRIVLLDRRSASGEPLRAVLSLTVGETDGEMAPPSMSFLSRRGKRADNDLRELSWIPVMEETAYRTRERVRDALGGIPLDVYRDNKARIEALIRRAFAIKRAVEGRRQSSPDDGSLG